MSIAKDLAALFHRDLTRLLQEIQSFPDEQTLWQITPGITNSAGTLTLHLEGNLREFIGRQLGAVPYERQRDQEFSQRNVPAEELLVRIENLRKTIPDVIASLSAEKLEAAYSQQVFKADMSTLQFLISLHAHLNWHLGQIDYLRRFLAQAAAIELASL